MTGIFRPKPMCTDLIKAFVQYLGYTYTLTKENVFDISK